MGEQRAVSPTAVHTAISPLSFPHSNSDQAHSSESRYSDVVNPAAKALWYIESHFGQEITLGAIADVAGVSRYHMSRAFGAAIGRSVMQYVRGRRLTEAARSLACGAPDILAVALDAGYNSHEAFTRAFRDHFGLTPEAVRAQGDLNDIELVEATKMDETLLTNLQPPRFESGRTMLIAGLSDRYSAETSAGIPAQWQRFAPYLGHIPGQIGDATYGVICNGDDAGNTEYISGVEVSDFAKNSEGIKFLAHTRTEIRGVFSWRSYFDNPAGVVHDLEQMAAGIGTEDSRGSRVRTLWQRVRPFDWNGWLRNLDPD